MLLKVCVNGARRPDEHPALPLAPARIAAEVAEAARAGAGAAHVHVKDGAGADTLDGVGLSKVLTSVRAAAPRLAVGVTTGAWALPDPAQRVAAIRSWTVLPDFASVNWHEDGADVVAEALLAREIGVEAGLWNAEGVDAWLASPHRDECLRVLIELPDGLDAAATRAEATRLLSRVARGVRGAPAQSTPVLLHGEGSSCWPALELAYEHGLDTRIGLEDTLTMPDGTLAPSNAALVQAARAVAASRVD